MSQALTEAEVAVRANRLKLDHAAWKALDRQPSKVVVGLGAALLGLLAMQLSLHWKLSVLQAGLLGGVIVGIPLLVYEVAIQRQQINALIKLLQQQREGGA